MWAFLLNNQCRFFSSKPINSTLIGLLKAMPKEQKHIAEAQKQRRKIKEKSSKYSPGRVTLQVLGTGAKGAPRSLYVFSDQSRYLFNCGEGTQRLAHEHKMKLAKLEHIFITQPVWKNIGGLPGAALTIQDVGVPEITLHGPHGIEEIFVATRRFIIIKDLELRIAQCNENTQFEDNVLRIKYVPLTRASGEPSLTNSDDNLEIQQDDTDYYAHEHSGKRTRPQIISETSRVHLQEIKSRGVSMAYVCQLQPRPGALCLDKCVKLGVPPGPLLGKLKCGEDVVLANGTLVKASDVCDPDDPGPVFIVIDCPSEAYLDSLLENELFKKHQMTAINDEDIAYTVVHFTPSHVINHPRYKEWIERFSPSTQHLILNDSNTCMGSSAVHRIQYKLNLLSNDVFPILGDRGTEILDQQLTDLPSVKKIKSDSDCNSSISLDKLSVESRPCSPLEPFIHVNSLYSHHLRPKKGSDRSNELKIVPSEFIEETINLEEFPQVLHEVKQQLGQKIRNMVIRDYPRLLFLGTGSSIPNKTRNTSGILLEIDENCVILVDCGEGTYGQIVRFYGQDKCDAILSKVKAVYISHLHADHHLGLIGILEGREKAFNNLKLEAEPLFLLAPKQITWWLNFYDKCFEDIAKCFTLVPNSDLLMDTCSDENIFETLSLQDIKTCYVRHCPNAFGVSFVSKSGCKITYSGDTMPSENLVELGTDSDLLIHEATMEDELEKEALIKMHSTTSQAIEIGKRMNAKYTLLTHFSQRYAKLPRFNENFSENVGIAFDNMQIRLDELPLLPLLFPALKIMFAEHYEELEHKAAKRQLKIEREQNLM